MHSTLDVCYSGDVADDRFFHKTNDSDATQFYFLYPRIGPHSLHPSYCYPCQFTLIYLRFFFLVWATFWVIFSIGVLAAFAILGIMVFKVQHLRFWRPTRSADYSMPSAVYLRYGCSSWYVMFPASFAHNNHLLQLHFYQHDKKPISYSLLCF